MSVCALVTVLAACATAAPVAVTEEYATPSSSEAPAFPASPSDDDEPGEAALGGGWHRIEIGEVDTHDWDRVNLASGVTFRPRMRLASGAAGILVGVKPDEGSSTVWHSPDGRHWQLTARFEAAQRTVSPPLLAAGAEGFVAIHMGDPEAAAHGGQHEVSVWYSSDGTGWEAVETDGFTRAGFLNDVAATANGFVAVGDVTLPGGRDRVPMIWRSADGLGWQQVLAAGGQRGSVRGLVPHGPSLVAVGDLAGRPTVWRSDDGVQWAATRLPADTHGGWAAGGAWMGTQFVAVGIADERARAGVWVSPDGTNWQRGAPPDPSPDLPDTARRERVLDVTRLGDLAVVGIELRRHNHDNWCFAGERCFLRSTELLLTADGAEWRSLPLPYEPAYNNDVPLAATSAGELVTGAVIDGVVTVWIRETVDDAAPFQPDPPPPPLDIDRIRSGDEVEPGVRYAYWLGTHWGIERLGVFNGVRWVLDPDFVRPEGQRSFVGDGVYGTLILRNDDRIVFRSAGETVGLYLPTDSDSGG